MATVCLLGISGTKQKLAGTIHFADASPADVPLESSLTADLKDFNADKRTSRTLGGKTVETPTETGFTTTINR